MLGLFGLLERDGSDRWVSRAKTGTHQVGEDWLAMVRFSPPRLWELVFVPVDCYGTLSSGAAGLRPQNGLGVINNVFRCYQLSPGGQNCSQMRASELRARPHNTHLTNGARRCGLQAKRNSKSPGQPGRITQTQGHHCGLAEADPAR